MITKNWLFGQPVLRYQNNGMAGWCKENSLSQWQKGGGWTANLYGGAQTANDDWAAVFVPVNDMMLADLDSAMWSYLMTGTETMGVNLVIWVHDPTDFDKRAEITQLGNASGLEKAAGWNAHELDSTVTQFFYYGENTGATLTKGTQYTLDQFKADAAFDGWAIYRLSLEYGWDASGTFDDVWVANFRVNGVNIPMEPGPNDHVGGEVKTVTQKTTGTSTTKATMLTPADAKRIRIVSVAVSNLSNTGTEMEVYYHTGATLDTTVGKAIFSAWCDTDYVSSASQSWPDGAGPVGAVGEVVTIRTSVDITTNGRVTISYREE